MKDGTAIARFIVVFDPKGGVGKTTVAQGAAYALMQDGQPFSIVDSDNENPDVYKSYARWDDGAGTFVKKHDHIEVAFQALKADTDFIELGNRLEASSGTVLLNTAAGSGKELLPHWRDLFEAAEAGGRALTILYPLDRGRDTLESLRDFVDEVVDEKQHPDRRIVVLKNLFFGEERRFKRFDAWASAHKPAAMVVASWPELNELIVDKLADQRATLDRSDLLTLMERNSLKKYQRDIVDLMTEVGVIDG